MPLDPGPDWKAIGTGDFNHDGVSDILFQNSAGRVAIWEIDGSGLRANAGVIGGGNVSLDPGPGWKAIGTGDFTGAGSSDILFQNTSSGQIAIWEMNGTNVIGGGTVNLDPGPSWHAVGTNSGGSDILFQNPNGQTAVWDMNGINVVGGGVANPNPGSSWKAINLT